MWPKLLDLTEDECRGILRRLELESYSNVLGAFRAQGTLNAVKLRILKDLREAFHISDARHKAEVRRVVNDESLSTIAKMTYGPNTEIEWSKEGSRGFLILNRKPGQTALSAIANKVSELGDTLNKNLKSPAQTNRQRKLHIENDADKIVTNDPSDVQSIAKSKAEKANAVQTPIVAETKNRDFNKHQQQQNSSNNSVNEKVALTNNSTKTIAENGFTATVTSTITTVDKTKQSELLKVMEMPTPTPTPMQTSATAVAVGTAGAPMLAPTSKSAPKPSPITSNSRRRKSISTLVANHIPAKAMLISNRGRRDTMIETCPKIHEHHQPPEPLRRIAKESPLAFPHKKSTATNNIARTISQKLEPPPPVSSTTVFATKASLPPPQPQSQPQLPPPPPTSQKRTHMPNNDDVQIIEAFVPHNVSTIKGTRNVMNAISQGAQLVKVIDSKIIKHPVTISNMYVTAPAKSTPAPIQVQQSSQPHAIKPIADAGRLTKFVGNKGAKVEIIALPPPSARNPNIVKTSDKIMHVSPHLLPAQKSNQIIRTAVTPMGGSSSGAAAGGTHHITSNINTQNHHKTTTTISVPKYQQKNHVVQVVQSQPRMVTIHPNSGILTVPTNMTTANEPTTEYIYEEPINDWQNYDPSHIEQPNGYMKIINKSRSVASNIEHDYQRHEAEICYDVVDHDDIITEEYITDDFSMDNVIEMDTDGGGTIYTANDNNVVTFVSNNVIGS